MVKSSYPHMFHHYLTRVSFQSEGDGEGRGENPDTRRRGKEEKNKWDMEGKQRDRPKKMGVKDTGK